MGADVPAGLSQEPCEACTAATPRLSDAEVATLGAALASRWTVAEQHLRCRIRCPDFAAAMALATRVALLAEAEGHHPELTVAWGRLGVDLTTHAIRGLSRNDFVMAAKIDALVGPPGP